MAENTTYPYSDEMMYYDYTKHRYILTAECVLQELNIDLADRLNTSGSNNKENTPKYILDIISMQIYNFIYSFSTKYLYVQWLLAKMPSARDILKECMKQQVLYFLINGQIDKYSGVDFRKNTGIELNRIRGINAIDPMTYNMLQQPLYETGVSLLYTGRYPVLFRCPKYKEDNY